MLIKGKNGFPIFAWKTVMTHLNQFDSTELAVTVLIEPVPDLSQSKIVWKFTKASVSSIQFAVHFKAAIQ